MTNNDRIAREGTLGSQIKLYYDLILPVTQLAPLLIALHGYGANKRQMMRSSQPLCLTVLPSPRYKAFIST